MAGWTNSKKSLVEFFLRSKMFPLKTMEKFLPSTPDSVFKVRINSLNVSYVQFPLHCYELKVTVVIFFRF